MNALVFGMEDKEVRARMDGEYIRGETTTAIHPSIGLIAVECISYIILHPSWYMDGIVHTLDIYSKYTGMVLHTYSVVSCGVTIMGSAVCYHFNIVGGEASEASAPQGEG